MCETQSSGNPSGSGVIRVAVAGASGYAGAEILRLLLAHPAYLDGTIQIGALTGASTAGKTVGELMPHLSDLAECVIEPTTQETLAGHDVVFLALPHGHSAEIATQLGEDAVIIDCAADFRLRSEQDWDAYYGGTYAGHWPYGLPEVAHNREELRGSKRVAVPGCFPTGATLAMAPSFAAGLVEQDVNIVSITGVSGAGKKANVDLLGSETMGSLKAYNTAGKHRHNPEIRQNLAGAAAHGAKGQALEPKVSFTPVLAPLPRGILTTATAFLREGVELQDVRQAYAEYYAGEAFVRILPEGQQPQTQNVVGSNMCHLQVEVDEAAGKLLVTTAIDNLCKGTAGAAVQCMNLALGLQETAGLPRNAVAP
ncbi:N-acetyl-gamma-glutamyl-phosphate reductase [Corynebacterium sp. 153RC1]|uniref:N-acetyl-gamma-glutamyl-phosphate reductase n=1 Tax=unclassified Corynebacterium TaxID=2624378 RepID=UPI00211BD09C|nr:MULTISPECIES: N-acetyl-gamma-glutamyl-phosphate reductase [unclassified Corynebacterium]MCQ9353165.1 N-acetyl-gamma-glutamyl-phosphate reductase [Corynebacterium sp. 209RC1]MCQ9353896.1 N-acetyl-gamma-glutamyl-phosphate reductase [Corynebacterium sp. 1222RC1]MCQ9356927.1 N-acetyl-gamma-glutamyl-phosphate reductase [Corynebacterium sp. 122RC1]MCQ9359741.1 N-acetyl-gamma-glutamyl-phosphate reductase [Corynebacterium sp. 142RC1]MCQ9361395.1 N-acetyl-gamma-glutamyl-phosphate reductase [Coryneba